MADFLLAFALGNLFINDTRAYQAPYILMKHAVNLLTI